MDTTVPTAAASRPDELTTTRLAALLGFNRRTIAKLRLLGAPASTDERAWRSWCRDHSRRCKPAVAALDLAIPRGTDEINPAPNPAGAAPADSSAPPAGDEAQATVDFSVHNWTQRKAQRGAQLLEVQAEKAQIELDEKRRVLIHRDDVVRLVEVVATALLTELIDLPAKSVGALVRLPSDWRRPVRRSIEDEIIQLRKRVAAHLRRQVHAAFANPEETTRAG